MSSKMGLQVLMSKILPGVRVGGAGCHGVRHISTSSEPKCGVLPKLIKENRPVKENANRNTGKVGEGEDFGSVIANIHKHLRADSDKTLADISTYYFNGEGKFIRPRLTLAMAKAINSHKKVRDKKVLDLQREIALISEMWHVSSLVHDDVIDHAETRRQMESVNVRWGCHQSVLGGDYILSVSSKLLAQTKNPEVIMAMCRVLTDLVNGELQQMMNRENEKDRFELYLEKTFNKTASLMAYSCKSVALLADSKDEELAQMSFCYGRNVGIAFQLIDDYLDFVSSAELLGKPAAADLKLGLATAPVLFAAKEFPHLNPLILRRFSVPGDIDIAFSTVQESQGLKKTRDLAVKYAEQSIKDIAGLVSSSAKEELETLAMTTISRCH